VGRRVEGCSLTGAAAAEFDTLPIVGTITRIFLRPSARTPVKEVESAEAVRGRGLEGDHSGGGNRQVTIISEERWVDACRDLGSDVSPGGRRANVVVEGVRLEDAIGHELHLGECRIKVIGETRPCRLMDDFAPGLQKALDPDCRGGVYGRVVEGGLIEVAASVGVVKQEAA